MQYSVPQFVDIEDKIFGPLTLKQFFVLLFGAIIGFMFWSIFGPGLIFFVIMIPVALIIIWLALGKFNGQPVMGIFPVIISFFLKPRYRVFHRISDSTLMIDTKKSDEKESKIVSNKPTSYSARSSRLKNLAYVLDQQSAEEDRLASQIPDAPKQNIKQ